MQPDADDLAVSSRFRPTQWFIPKRTVPGYAPAGAVSLGWPMIVVIVKVPMHQVRPVCSWAAGCYMMFCCPTKQEKPMLMSTDRILVSHVGSLPRPPTLSELLIRQEAGETIDTAELARQVEIATTHVIDKQVEAGVDVGNDGEQSRVGFQTYVSRCLCGFGGESRRPRSRDQIDFPSYARQTELRFPHSARVAIAPAALSDVQYVDSAPINEDAARLKRMGSRFSECFMTAPSPGIVATTMLNQHYESHEAYLTALAKALSNEYRAIHNAGMVLQIDAPDLAMERNRFFSHLGEAEFLRQLELHIVAINLGL
jgi:5-methyltetrahydropteroyltriglutamate--homocysteine methyltransferase